MANEIEIAEARFDAACQAFANAMRAMKRSKSAKNVAAFVAARSEHEEASESLRALNAKAERAATVARRLEAVAGRRAQRAAQGNLF